VYTIDFTKMFPKEIVGQELKKVVELKKAFSFEHHQSSQCGECKNPASQLI
jgi:hypothetical protein